MRSRRFQLAMIHFAALLSALLSGISPAFTQQHGEERPKPDLAEASYGPHERNVLDLWQAKSDEPTPLLVYIHGGGFRGGSKQSVPGPLLKDCLERGISVASINYRLSPEVAFPAHYLDSTRAIQFARHKAKEWNIDPSRIAAGGGSAGAGTSLWIGFHDDLADPQSEDPVLRESSRLSCMVVFGAQSTYDPRVIKKIVGGRAHEHPALQGFYGLKTEELDTEDAYNLYEAASPINYLTEDDPPVYALYNGPRGPLPEDARPGQGIHHINFGTYLKEKMDALKIRCVIRHRDEEQNDRREQIEFLTKHLGVR